MVSALWSMSSCFQTRQLAAEIFQLPVVHERLVLGGTVIVRKKGFGLHRCSLLQRRTRLTVVFIVIRHSFGRCIIASLRDCH